MELTKANAKKCFNFLFDINQIIKKRGSYSIISKYLVGRNFFAILDAPPLDSLKGVARTNAEIFNYMFDNHERRYYIEDPLGFVNYKNNYNKFFENTTFEEDSAITFHYSNQLKFVIKTATPNVEKLATIRSMLLDIEKFDFIYELHNKEYHLKTNYITVTKNDVSVILPANIFFSTPSSNSTIELVFIKNKAHESLYDLYIVEAFPDEYITLVQKTSFIDFGTTHLQETPSNEVDI